ncbi:siroheme synthase CysG [uncultured Roseibium sp.]|uniref:siroheme synthase CysG n=1 Tax=uncultured Roseibium sp. TaxID=1936171 RepID=UPI0026030136|nr:siroheme synthase CysG [uncultured Roseibium sp.]
MSTLRRPVEVGSKRQAVRVEPLASVPLFFSLEGKRVVLAGGTDAAAWKAELLAAAGAEVHVFAEQLEQTFERLLEAGSVKGRFVHHQKCWSMDSFEGACLAIADARSQGEAQAFFCAAKAAGVPVNVIDNPPFCEFQFGSIVNRSPVVIGVSTNGAAPILGQAIRRRIETLLPSSLRVWAVLAQQIRGRVMKSLAVGAERRRFWERFVDLAFSSRSAPETMNLEEFEQLLDEAGHVRQGRVTLVGAGPGDAENLTLKAMRALQAADVILFDDLVDDTVLELARREAKRMMVGKRGGRESCRQEDINDLMVSLARQGKNVVRLKSGDPMIFGRAGEELQRLSDEGIPASVVPGITSASAMAAELGISLTHRDHAQSVRFVTGHARNGKLPETVDWKGLTDPATTTVFYMAGRMAERISARLIAEGLSSQTPVRVMTNISRHNAASWSGCLTNLAKGVDSLQSTGPVLIAVGDVFAQTCIEQHTLPGQQRAAQTATA